MKDMTKIVTCGYCSTRAVLDLRGSSRHELCCASCGAPIHLIKPLKVEKTKPPKNQRYGAAERNRERLYKPKKRKLKKRKPLFEKIWDELEDIFD